MSQQPSVASYFGKRKRINTEDIYKAKLAKTDDGLNVNSKKFSVPVVQKLNSNDISVVKAGNTKVRDDAIKKIETSNPSAIQQNSKPKKQVDIRESLKKFAAKKPPEPSSLDSPVKFQLLGSLSPAKKSGTKVNLIKNESQDSLQIKSNEEVSQSSGSCMKKPTVRKLNLEEGKNCALSDVKKSTETEDIIKSANNLVSKIKEAQKKLNGEETPKKELSLKEIKDKIIRSSKLSELKKSIDKLNDHAQELIELEKKKLVGAQPKLSKFKTIDIEVPVSPKKINLLSPNKVNTLAPAHERFAALASAPTPLPLPLKFLKLYEFFESVDTVCSMMVNRREIITFNKLKPAVEEMTRRNFTPNHLGQIATVLPNAFSFHQEKIRNFGSTSKVDKYELVISPKITQPMENSSSSILTKDDDIFIIADKSLMTPKELKARRESFYNALLDLVKDHHEAFLESLDPPIKINKHELKRWHPQYLVDLIPDIIPQELPLPPTSEKPATAKEVLERAKILLSSNARLHKALEAAAESSENLTPTAPNVSLEIKEKVDARLNNPLRGVPKSLLEKVRARQAAKALEAMRMTPAQEKETLMYTRLPDIARIVRTIFINEQKGVILLETVVEKVQFSYNRSLTLSEVEAHIRLLVEKLPEWISVIHIRHTDYLKIHRSIDVAFIMNKLHKIVENKKQEMKIN